MIYNISNYEKIKQDYNKLLQKVRDSWSPQYIKLLDLDKSKVSRIFKGKFDLLTLSRMASICGINCSIEFTERK